MFEQTLPPTRQKKIPQSLEPAAAVSPRLFPRLDPVFDSGLNICRNAPLSSCTSAPASKSSVAAATCGLCSVASALPPRRPALIEASCECAADDEASSSGLFTPKPSQASPFQSKVLLPLPLSADPAAADATSFCCPPPGLRFFCCRLRMRMLV